MGIVELAHAYVWDCEDCGRENWQRCISKRLDPNDDGDADLIRQLEDLEPDEPIEDDPHTRRRVQTRPNRVTCRHCGAEFRAVDSGAPDSEIGD